MNSIYDPAYELMIKRLECARKQRGMRQVDVARRLGKHQSYVSKIENCERRLDIAELKQFLSIYGISSGEIFGD